MGQALYRKYRSKALSEIVGQEHITTTLERAINDGTMAHAYLFTGPRGSGKTSIARILAHRINNIEYTDESMHLDIIEIDAASNRRIDEIRELRDKVHMAPTSAKYKVYIIDEVHMLTKEAFNALLKTLEEPPAHVVFILATTELHKVPDTIISRTQRFAFKPVEADKVVAHLRYIADQEAIDIDDQALLLITEHGGGSFRDSISLLDQMRNAPEKPVTADAVRLLLGVPETAATSALLESIRTGGQAATLAHIQKLLDQGFGAPQIASQLYDHAKQLLLDGAIDSTALLDLMQNLLTVSAANNPTLKLELVALQASTPATPQPTQIPTPVAQPQLAVPPVKTQLTPQPAAQEVESSSPVPATKTAVASQTAPAEPKPQTAEPASAESQATESTPEPADIAPSKSDAQNTPSAPLDAGLWSRVLMEAKSHNNTLYGVLRMAHPTFDGTKLTLAFAYPFHQKKLNDATNKGFVADWVRKLSGQSVSVEVVVDKSVSSQPPDLSAAPITTAPVTAAPPSPVATQSPAPNPSQQPAAGSDGVKSIMDVFGGGEVL